MKANYVRNRSTSTFLVNPRHFLVLILLAISSFSIGQGGGVTSPTTFYYSGTTATVGTQINAMIVGAPPAGVTNYRLAWVYGIVLINLCILT